MLEGWVRLGGPCSSSETKQGQNRGVRRGSVPEGRSGWEEPVAPGKVSNPK